MFSWARPDRVATKRTISSSAASSGSRLPRAASRRWRTSAITGPAAVDHVGGEAVAHRAGQALDGVEHRGRPRSSEATAPRPCWKAALSGAASAAARSIRSAWLEQPAEQAQLDRIARAHRALRHPGRRGAQQPGIVVEALDVAAEPVEIVGDAALQVGAAALDGELVEAPGRSGPARRPRPRPAPRRPSACRSAGRASAARYRPPARAPARPAARDSRRHRRSTKHAHHHGRRHQARAVPFGAERRGHGILRHELAGLRARCAASSALRSARFQHADHDRLAVRRRGRAARSSGRDWPARRHRPPARPATTRRATAGCSGSPSRCSLSRSRNGIIAGVSTTPEPSALASEILPLRVASTRPVTPSAEVGAQLQRIGEGAVEAAQQHVHGAQAGQRLDRHLAVARHQVAALDQRHAERAREIDMLEVGRRQRARRQHRHVGVAPRRAAPWRASELCQRSTNGRRWRTGIERNASGRLRASTRRISSA